MNKEERQQKFQKLKKELKRRAHLNKINARRKTLQEKRLEKSSLSKSQSSFDKSYLQRVVLLSNNRSLARALENSRVEVRSLTNEIEALKNVNLAVEMERCELQIRFKNLKKAVQLLSSNMVNSATILNDINKCLQRNSIDATIVNEEFQAIDQLPEIPILPSRVAVTNEFADKKMQFNMSAILELSNLDMDASFSCEEGDIDKEQLPEVSFSEPDVSYDDLHLANVIDKRRTYVVTASKQIQDVPSPIRNQRGRRLRRTTIVPANAGSTPDDEIKSETPAKYLPTNAGVTPDKGIKSKTPAEYLPANAGVTPEEGIKSKTPTEYLPINATVMDFIDMELTTHLNTPIQTADCGTAKSAYMPVISCGTHACVATNCGLQPVITPVISEQKCIKGYVGELDGDLSMQEPRLLQESCPGELQRARNNLHQEADLLNAISGMPNDPPVVLRKLPSMPNLQQNWSKLVSVAQNKACFHTSLRKSRSLSVLDKERCLIWTRDGPVTSSPEKYNRSPKTTKRFCDRRKSSGPFLLIRQRSLNSPGRVLNCIMPSFPNLPEHEKLKVDGGEKKELDNKEKLSPYFNFSLLKLDNKEKSGEKLKLEDKTNLGQKKLKKSTKRLKRKVELSELVASSSNGYNQENAITDAELEEQLTVERRHSSRRKKTVGYQEPPLNRKMRRA